MVILRVWKFSPHSVNWIYCRVSTARSKQLTRSDFKKFVIFCNYMRANGMIACRRSAAACWEPARLSALLVCQLIFWIEQPYDEICSFVCRKKLPSTRSMSCFSGSQNSFTSFEAKVSQHLSARAYLALQKPAELGATLFSAKRGQDEGFVDRFSLKPACLKIAVRKEKIFF